MTAWLMVALLFVLAGLVLVAGSVVEALTRPAPVMARRELEELDALEELWCR